MEKNLLDRKLKLIWDFKGPAAAKTAEHYEIHLKEYVTSEELKYDITGITHVSDSHSLVFLVVAEFEMPQVRDDLKPHRGQVYTEQNP